jgi:hypothetical protein
MFFIQIWEATLKLQNVPMMISTNTLLITEISPPLLMICPLGQYNDTKVKFSQLNGAFPLEMRGFPSAIFQ